MQVVVEDGSADINSKVGLVGALVTAVLGIAYGVRQYFLRWRRDASEFAGADAAVSEQRARKTIVEQLHEELTRMSAQNLLLSSELTKLQLHILELTRQIGLLTAENVSLKSEIVDLRGEITRLKGL